MNQHAKRRYQSGLRYLEEREAAEEAAREAVQAAVAAAAVPLLPTASGRFDFTVDQESARQRLDRYLAGAIEASGHALSRSRLAALVEEGQVSVDGKIAEDSGAKVRVGQTISVDIPPPVAPEPKPEDIPLDVVFEDEHLIVIDKPAGLVVHPAAGHETGTLVNALLHHCGDSLSGIGGVKRPGIVHRLDKDTSGLLVVAKSDAAHQGLAALFADHGRTLSLTREYLALLWTAPPRSEGTVDAPLGRHAHMRERQAIVRGERGREAITHWKVLEVFGGQKKPRATLVRCALETGRTHQIRVHMAHLGHPVMGDAVYANGFKTKASSLGPETRAALDALGRQALHAAVLGFTHPITGEELMFESEPPADMAALIEAVRKG